MAKARTAVCEVIAREIGYPLEQVTLASRLAEDLGLEFYDVAELVEPLESTFLTRIPDSALHCFRSVADVERFLRARLSAIGVRTSPTALVPRARRVYHDEASGGRRRCLSRPT